MKRAAVVGVVLIAAFAMTSGSAWAGSAVKLCVPKAAERPTLTPKRGKCKRGYKLTSLGAEGKEGKQGKPGAEGKPGPEGKTGPEGKRGPGGKTGPEGKAGTTGFTSGELETLKGILPCIKSVKAGIGGKPTVQFSGCNVQIVNGEGSTASTNGAGNLVIGYDESPQEQTGSHNLILGTLQAFTSYGGIDAGFGNTISAPYASVSGGGLNTASGAGSSVSGGSQNTASGFRSSVSGGFLNVASGAASAWIGGGFRNMITVKGAGEEGRFASIFGGKENKTSQEYAAIP
jgi:hypothetical protein